MLAFLKLGFSSSGIRLLFYSVAWACVKFADSPNAY